MRVAFDDQIFRAQARGGVSKYLVELAVRLPQHGARPVLPLDRSANRHAVEAGLAEPSKESRWRSRVEWATWRLAGHPHSPSPSRTDADLMHHTFTHPAYLRRWSGPRVVTIHDMTPELMPEHFRLGNPHFAKRRYAEAADAIICVSESTAADMLRLYGDHLRARVRVIPLGVDSRFLEPTSAPSSPLPDDYLLFVGVRAGYKRFDLAVSAAGRVMRDHPGLHFVIVGGGALTTAEQQLLRTNDVHENTIHITPSDAEMPSVYRGASAFLFPSEYEGFGLPTLEALASGAPAVLADASCSREVGGDAARYFPSGDLEGLVDAVEQALRSDAREEAAVAGPARARLFSWDRVAAATAEVYRDVLGATSGSGRKG